MDVTLSYWLNIAIRVGIVIIFDAIFPTPVPLLGGVRGGFLFPVPCSLFPLL
ncbi:MAG: hypothetical protein F6J90_06385 [Moorea sp. SIOASIH]|nr:hypothetical protein [Moorena sp. SIOASIH]NEO90181.1 hypothetical protein [Moorena sp. SIO3G5]